MMGIGFPELMIILVIIMIIFGAGKLPEIGSAFGNSIRNFKKSMKEAEEQTDEIQEAANVENAVSGGENSASSEEPSASSEEPSASSEEPKEPENPVAATKESGENQA